MCDDTKVVGNGVSDCFPFPGQGLVEEPEDGLGELSEIGIKPVVRHMPVHDAPNPAVAAMPLSGMARELKVRPFIFLLPDRVGRPARRHAPQRFKQTGPASDRGALDAAAALSMNRQALAELSMKAGAPPPRPPGLRAGSAPASPSGGRTQGHRPPSGSAPECSGRGRAG